MCELNLLGNNGQYIRYPFEDFLKAQKKFGIKEIDLTLQAPHIYVDSEEYEDLAAVQRAMKENGISVYCVTPLPYRYTICADAGSIQLEKTISYYKQCILAAQSLGASYLCVTASGGCYDYDGERLMKNAEAALMLLADFAGEHDVTLLLGTVLGEECPTNASTPVLVHAEEVKQVLENVHSPYLKVYMDTEVISLCGETITQWFEMFGGDLRLIRLTDGNYNGYRIWGRGCLPCRKYLDEIRDNGYHGKCSLQIPGEKYIVDPQTADGENLSYLKRMAEQERIWHQ